MHPFSQVQVKLQTVDSLPLYAHSERFRSGRDIKTLNQKIMTTYRLLIAIEHALPNCPLVDFRKKSRRDLAGHVGSDPNFHTLKLLTPASPSPCVPPICRRQAQAGILVFEYQDSDFKNCSIRVLISSLALRNTATLSSIVPIAIAGSSIDQWSRIP